MRPDEPDPGELRRPDLLLHAVVSYGPFSSPRTLLARVDGAYEQQVLAGVTRLWMEPPEGELDRARQTEQALQRLGFVSTGLPYRDWPMAVPIVIRPGPSWFSWDESEAVFGLRYGSNLCDVVQGDVLMVTPRGGTSWPAYTYGGQPQAQRQAALPGQPDPADQLAQLEASLEASSEQLTAPLPAECLQYLERMLSEFGCVGHRFTERWAQGRKVRGRARHGLGPGDGGLLLRLPSGHELPRPAVHSPPWTPVPGGDRRARGAGRPVLVTPRRRSRPCDVQWGCLAAERRRSTRWRPLNDFALHVECRTETRMAESLQQRRRPH
jgi:hypothetical protein